MEVLYNIWNNEADYIDPKENEAWQEGYTVVLNWGRGTGKTFCIMDIAILAANELEGISIGLWSSTYKSVQNISLQQSHKIWKSYGFSEFDEKYNPRGNYVVNRKPPGHFKKPINSPRQWENTIAFAKGQVIKMLSADMPDRARGENFDILLGSEVAFTKKDFYTKILKPGLRANVREFRDYRPHRKRFNHPLHWLSVMESSLPYTASGRWFLEYENKMIDNPRSYFFSRANAKDNKMNLPGNFIQSQKEELSEIEFQIEILNQLPSRLPNGFYPAFNDVIHVGTNYTYEFDKEFRRHVEHDRWYDPWKAIDMSWDFNGYFTCATCSQDFGKEYVFNNEFYAKESTLTLIEKVCDDFISEYKHHLKKIVNLFGDNSGNNKDPDRNVTLWNRIIQKLTAAGWTVVNKVQTTYPTFKDRYILIGDLLSEAKAHFPKIRIHAEKCKSLIIAIQNAGMKDKDNYEKDKGSEGVRSGVPQEFATHFTDAFDYVLYKLFSSLSALGSTRSVPIKVRVKQ